MSAADQVPVNSGFAAKTPAMDVLGDIDLGGKTAIVTGGYSGIGLEVVRALGSRGARVIVPVRTPAKARENLAGVLATFARRQWTSPIWARYASLPSGWQTIWAVLSC